MNQVLALNRTNIYPQPGIYQDYPSEHIAHGVRSFSEGSVILGMGYDRLPVRFDLYDPAPGAILIAGEAGSGKTQLLQSILRSAATLNRGRVSISIIANEHYQGSHFGVADMHLVQCRPYTLDAAQSIHSLVLLAIKRLIKGDKLPFILLAVDDLLSLWAQNEPQVQEDMVWLLKNGAAAGIWPVCTIAPAPDGSRQIPINVIESFRICLWGHIHLPGKVYGLDASDTAPLSCLTPGREFCLRLDSGWLCFHIIDPFRAASDDLIQPLSIPNKLVNATQGGHHEYWHVMV